MRYQTNKIFSRLRIVSGILILGLLALSSCDTPKLVDQPPPFIEIIDGPCGEVLDKDFATFVWKGSDEKYEFQYRTLVRDPDEVLKVHNEWSEWSNQTEVVFENLDEGEFTFEVRGESEGLTGTAECTFEVDAVKGPAVMFYKAETDIQLGEQNTVGIWMEDVDSLKAFRIMVSFDNSMLEFQGVEKGNYVEHQNFNQIILPEGISTDTLFVPKIEQINNIGTVEVNSSFLTTQNSRPRKTISGSGEILKMYFEGLNRGNTELQFTLIQLYDANNNLIQPNSTKSGIVNIK